MSSDIRPGAFVRSKTDPTRTGIVLEEEKVSAGQRLVRLQLNDGRAIWRPVEILEPVPAAPETARELFERGRFVDPEWLRRTLTRIRVTGRMSDIVYSMEATGTEFYAHQFKPVLKLLDSPTDALLIADEVGMGKTIEAGLIWTELRARFESNRLLVVCPKTLSEKWRDELDHRFGVDAQIVDATELQRVLQDRSGNGRGFAIVAGMQALRPPRGWEEEEKGNPRARLARFLHASFQGAPLIDLLVVDEAHHMRNSKTLLHNLGELLNDVSTHRIFLSATPIMLGNRDLHSLLKLIDRGTFERPETLDDLIAANEPIVRARSLLMNPNTHKNEIIDAIDAVGESPVLSGSKSLELIRQDLVLRPLDAETRTDIASRLETVNQMANFVTRSRRRDVQDFKTARKPVARVLQMTDEERTFYEAITNEVKSYASSCNANERFLLSTPQRLLTSSLAAASTYWAARHVDKPDEVEETDDDLNLESVEYKPLVERLSALSRDMNATESLKANDVKFNALLDDLNNLWRSQSSAKIVVFSSFKPTLNYLRDRLERKGIICALIHGSVAGSRGRILKKFRDDKDVRVLLSSEVGGEGIDLQFCWNVVNYDLPWNPMKVEQRVGRVDRLGQEKEFVRVVNLLYDNTIDSIIWERLYERLGLAERALGEFETLLGDPIRDMTLKLLQPELGQRDREKIVEQTAIAVENKKIQIDKLEEKAGAFIAHGDFIVDKIARAREGRQWLHKNDIQVFVTDQLNRNFRGCKIESAPPGSDTYRIVLTPEARDKMARFADRRGFRGSRLLTSDSGRTRFRFSSSVAEREDGKAEVISRNHTLVRFAVELLDGDSEARHARPVAAVVTQEDLLGTDSVPGTYVIGVRQLRVNAGGSRNSGDARIAYAGAAANGGGKLLTPELAENMVRVAAVHGRMLPNFAHDERHPAAVDVLCSVVEPELDRIYERYVEEMTRNISDRSAIRESALERHFGARKKILIEQIHGLENDADLAESLGNKQRAQRLGALVKARQGMLRKLERKVEQTQEEIEIQRRVEHEVEDIAYLFIEVAP